MRPRRPAPVVVLVAVVMALPLLLPGLTPGAVAALPAGSAATSTRPPTPARGHFHPLAAPARVVSTATGTGIASRPVPAGAERTLAIGGHAGVPATGVEAVAVTLTAVRPAGATRLWAAAGRSKPDVWSLATAGATTSAYAVLPVSSTGVAHLWNGPHATDLTVDVTGWFSSASETGNAGLFNRLASRQVNVFTLRSGATKTVAMAGVEDVPVVGAKALLLRVHAIGAAGSGGITLAPTKAATKPVTSLAYTAGDSSDLVTAKLGSTGSVVVRNAGPKRVTVAIDALGWFTDGLQNKQFGDVLHLSSSPGKVLDAVPVNHSGVTTAVTAVRGVPAETTTSPPSLVLLRMAAEDPTSPGAVTVDPAGATPEHLPALATRSNRPSAGLAFAPPGSTGAARVGTFAGSATVSAEAFAWFAGAVVVAAGTQVVTGALAAAVQTVTTDSVTFTGQPDALATLAVGDVLVAGVTPTTPFGLLRKAASIDRSGADLVVSTTNASLADTVIQGSLSAGGSGVPPAASTAAAVRPAAASTQAATTAADCNTSGSLLFGGMTLACSHSFGPGASEWLVQTDASATAAMGVDVSIGWGTPPKVQATTTLDVSGSTSATIDAHLHADLDQTYPMGKKTWAPIDFQLGPIPVVIVPETDAQLHVTGTVEETLNGIVSYSAALGVVCDSSGGCSRTHSGGGSASGSYQHTFGANVKAAFEPKIAALLYDVAGLTATLSPYVEAKADSCTLTFLSGIDLAVGIELAPFGETLTSAQAAIPLVQTTLAEVPLQNCAIWSGSFHFRS
ncbi:MAG: hypothetical protein ABJA74_16860, partial [Lapillicoccus sp.]